MKNSLGALCFARILSYLAKMRAHGLACSLRIAMFDGLQNPFVVVLTALGAALRVVGAHALLAEKAYDGIDQREDEWIAGGFRKSKMEIQVALNKTGGILAGRVHHTDRFPHGGEHVFVCALSGQRRNFRFENLSNLREMHSTFRGPAAQHAIQRKPYRMSVSVGYKSSEAGVGFHQSLFAQGLHCFANCSTANAELMCQFSFGR